MGKLKNFGIKLLAVIGLSTTLSNSPQFTNRENEFVPIERLDETVQKIETPKSEISKF